MGEGGGPLSKSVPVLSAGHGEAFRCPSPSWPGCPSPARGRALNQGTCSDCPSYGPSAMAMTCPHGPAAPGAVPDPRRWRQGVSEQRALFLPGRVTRQRLRSAFLSWGPLQSADGCGLIMVPLSPEGGDRVGGTSGTVVSPEGQVQRGDGAGAMLAGGCSWQGTRGQGAFMTQPDVAEMVGLGLCMFSDLW